MPAEVDTFHPEQYKIIIRFWFQTYEALTKFHQILPDYSNGFTTYNGDVHPYKTCVGRIICIFSAFQLDKFRKTLSIGCNFASFSEVLLDDELVRTIFFIHSKEVEKTH